MREFEYSSLTSIGPKLTYVPHLKSGSLVALHEACLTLRMGQSRMAIVGGTEVLLHPDQNVSMSSGGYVNLYHDRF